jgi:hypothetical protein
MRSITWLVQKSGADWSADKSPNVTFPALATRNRTVRFPEEFRAPKAYESLGGTNPRRANLCLWGFGILADARSGSVIATACAATCVVPVSVRCVPVLRAALIADSERWGVAARSGTTAADRCSKVATARARFGPCRVTEKPLRLGVTREAAPEAGSSGRRFRRQSSARRNRGTLAAHRSVGPAHRHRRVAARPPEGCGRGRGWPCGPSWRASRSGGCDVRMKCRGKPCRTGTYAGLSGGGDGLGFDLARPRPLHLASLASLLLPAVARGALGRGGARSPVRCTGLGGLARGLWARWRAWPVVLWLRRPGAL